MRNAAERREQRQESYRFLRLLEGCAMEAGSVWDAQTKMLAPVSDPQLASLVLLCERPPALDEFDYGILLPILRREQVRRALDAGDSEALSEVVHWAMWDAAAKLFENSSYSSLGAHVQDKRSMDFDNGGRHVASLIVSALEVEQAEYDYLDHPEDEGQEIDHGNDQITWTDIGRMEQGGWTEHDRMEDE